MLRLKFLPSAAICGLMALLSCTGGGGPADGRYRIELLTTGDVHGSWFDSTYVGGGTRKSLFAVNRCVDSLRVRYGAENVILLDAGDCLQGDNAAYYFNYVDTLSPHLYARLAAYMKYDAIVVGNHDIEAGHPVYDRIALALKQSGIPFLAGNAIRTDNGRPYFPTYTILRRKGLKIAVLGYTNPNIKAWLSDELWSGMEFKSLLPLVQEDVDWVRAEEHPQAVIVAVHAGTGRGDGGSYENQGLDLYRTLRGVDLLVCAHDHRPCIRLNDSIALLNSGSHARHLGHGSLLLEIRDGKVVSKQLQAELIPTAAKGADPVMRACFRMDYEKVKAFTLREVGNLDEELRTREAFRGMCGYMNLLHTISLYRNRAQISFAAPLTYDGTVRAGTLLYNDLFTIYPFENQLFVLKLTGRQIKDYLEYSYEQWICTVPGPHLLKIRSGRDARFGTENWSFVNRSYNFDSAAGLDYTVDVTQPYGRRVCIRSLADGSPFAPDSVYRVAMTSYRANGGGGLLPKGAGVDTDRLDSLLVEKSPEIRNLLYDYILETGGITRAAISNPKTLGSWKFVPEKIAAPLLEQDMKLLFR